MVAWAPLAHGGEAVGGVREVIADKFGARTTSCGSAARITLSSCSVRVRGQHVIIDLDDVETAELKGTCRATLPGLCERGTRASAGLGLPMWSRIQTDVGKWADWVLVCSEAERVEVALPNAVVVRRTASRPGDRTSQGRRNGRHLLMVGS